MQQGCQAGQRRALRALGRWEWQAGPGLQSPLAPPLLFSRRGARPAGSNSDAPSRWPAEVSLRLGFPALRLAPGALPVRSLSALEWLACTQAVRRCDSPRSGRCLCYRHRRRRRLRGSGCAGRCAAAAAALAQPPARGTDQAAAQEHGMSGWPDAAASGAGGRNSGRRASAARAAGAGLYSRQFIPPNRGLLLQKDRHRWGHSWLLRTRLHRCRLFKGWLRPRRATPAPAPAQARAWWAACRGRWTSTLSRGRRSTCWRCRRATFGRLFLLAAAGAACQPLGGAQGVCPGALGWAAAECMHACQQGAVATPPIPCAGVVQAAADLLADPR